MKCELCRATFTAYRGSIISTEYGKIGICPSCHEATFQRGSRYNIDIMIVPVTEDSFNTAMNKRKYICPSTYIRKKIPKFIAFYRGGKIGAITHVARVTNVKHAASSSAITAILKLQKHSVWMDKRKFHIFNFLKPVPLRHKISRGGSPPIQNRIYKTFKQFSASRKIEDLYMQS